jgi:hypothetical protein
VLVHEECNFQLGPHTVSRTDQHRLFHIGDIEREQTAKSPDFTHDTGNARLFGNRLDGMDQAVGFIDVHARIGIGQWFVHRYSRKWMFLKKGRE